MLVFGAYVRIDLRLTTRDELLRGPHQVADPHECRIGAYF